ncbi:MAG: MMPL family transporter [Spirochaetales bacterium]|nr:MMPL family transporter [Spirochaetales bacterium]
MKFIIHWLAKKPAVPVLGIIALTAVFIFALAGNASLETDLDTYMPSDHPAFVFSDEAEAQFGIEDSVLIVVEAPETIYKPGSLEKIRAITETLPERFSAFEEGSITSLYTADNITSSGWGLEVEPFYIDIPETSEELRALQEAVEGNEMIYGRNISKDGTSALIIAEIADKEFSDQLYADLQKYAEELEGPERIRIAGRPIVEGALAELGPEDMTRMAPIVMLLMIVILLILLKNIRDTLINMIIVLFGTITAFGTKALFDIPIYAVDTMIPVMLIAIGVAYGIHMHNTIHHLIIAEPELSRSELVQKTLKSMIRPVSMAAITTAVGFMALMTSQVLPVRFFGLFASIGVLTEMLLALVLFPASIYVLGPPKNAKPKNAKPKNAKSKEAKYPHPQPENTKALEPARRMGMKHALITHPGRILLIALAVVALAGAGAGRVWIDTSFLANFQDDSEIVKTDEFVNSRFGGTSTLNVILTADEDDTFKNPEVLRLMDEMQQEAEKMAEVGESFSLTDFMKRMNMVMFENDPDYNSIPETREMTAQYLLLYEMSGDPETMEQVVDYDYRSANITFQLKSDSSAVMQKVIEHADAYADEFEDLGIRVQYAGSGFKAMVFADLLMEGQIFSLGLSFIIVAVLLALLFKNWIIGIAGTIPIAVTAVINFGSMGILGIPLSSATALISSIAIGIGVDYAIHLIEHYRVQRLEGSSIHTAALETLSHTGRAIIYNAVAVMGGFGVLLFSVFPPNRQVGGLIALNMASSAIGTLTVLLVVIIYLDKKGLFLKNLKEAK